MTTEPRDRGICGAAAPTLFSGTLGEVCTLLAGHDGWHAAGAMTWGEATQAPYFTQADVDAAYERGKAEQAAEVARLLDVVRAKYGEIERLQALLDHAEQYARDLQDGEGWDREEEWALSYTLNGTPQAPGHGGSVFSDRAEAQRHIEAWQRHYPDLTYADVKYHRREILTGEWQPETETPDA
jgi:hypothetical protein